MSTIAKTKILIVDDQLDFYDDFRRVFQDRYDFFTVDNFFIGLELIEKGEEYEIVLLDLEFRPRNYQFGLDTILPKAVEKAKEKYPIIVCTQDTRTATYRRALKNGADLLLYKNDYEPQEWDEEIRKTIQDFKSKKEIDKISQEKEEIAVKDTFISASANMEQLKKQLQLFPQFGSTAPVLLLGETGVGKEVAAKYLHQCKANNDLPFVAINLSALLGTTLESELFGHVKGAFTDAKSDKTGLFETAKGGTLFLDEIGEISLDMQVKLLRVLQEKTFRKVGGTTSIPLEAHLIFATNTNFQEAIAAKTFRQDFYQRISVHNFEIPSLRKRQDDIIPLLDHFLANKDICPETFHMYQKAAKICFTEGALSKLFQYHWPGNIRELRNSLQKMLFDAFAAGKQQIDEEILPDRFKQPAFALNSSPSSQVNSGIVGSVSPDSLQWPIVKQTAYTELAGIEKALIDSGGRKNDAAQLLGLRNDQTIRYKVKIKYFNTYPDLFDFFPTIRKVYKL